ncbi:MAG: CPBP family intramembrane glutamic endopeptidase [Flavobacteriales bacterium]
MRRLRNHPVLAFVLLTLGLQVTVMAFVGWKLGQHAGGARIHDDDQAHMVFRLRVFGPLVFAALITAWLEGKAGLRNLFGSFLTWRVAPKWYMLAFSWKFIFTYAGITALLLLGIRDWPGMGWVAGVGDAGFEKAIDELRANLLFIVGIAFVEETAWMKFCVTRMQERHSSLVSCLFVGLAWGLWYLPMLLVREGVPDGYPWPVFLLSMVCLTILLSWVYNATRSGLVLMIMQIVSNTAFFIIPVLPDWHAGDAAYVNSFVAVNFLSATTIVLVYGAKDLGYRPRARWSDGLTAGPVKAPAVNHPLSTTRGTLK